VDSASASSVESNNLANLQSRLTLPAVLASSIGGLLLAASAAMWGLAVWLFYAGSDEFLPGGIEAIPPTEAEIIHGVLTHVGPVVVGFVLLGLTWRYRSQGRQRATWLAAVGTITAGLTTFF
jgi:hypothetical protein